MPASRARPTRPVLSLCHEVAGVRRPRGGRGGTDTCEGPIRVSHNDVAVRVRHDWLECRVNAPAANEDRDPLRARTRRGWAWVAAGIVVFTLAATFGNWARHASLTSTWPFDLGTFHNQALNQAQGRDISYVFIPSWFKEGDFEGPSVHRSNHFSPLRLWIVPQVYRVWPRLETLMAVQALLIGLGAAALYGIATDKGAPAWLGILLAGSYLLHPAIVHLAVNDYRDIALGVGPGLLALWFHATGRTRGFVVAALVMLSARSEYVLLLGAFGVLNWRLRPAETRRAHAFLVPLGIATLWALLSHAYYVYFYAVPWPLLAFGAGRSLADTATELARRLIPFTEVMLAPALLGLAAPEALIVALPFVALAKRLVGVEFPPHHLQHLSPAFVAVFWAFAASTLRLSAQLRSPRARRLSATALVAIVLLSAVWFAWAAARAYSYRPQRLARLEQLADLPTDATLVVPNDLLAAFSGHTRVLTYELLPVARPYASEDDRRRALAGVLTCADLVVTMREASVDEAVAATGLFEPPRDLQRFRAFVRRPEAPRSANPDADLQRALYWNELTPLQRRGAAWARWR